MKVNRQLLCAGITCLLLSGGPAVATATATAANGPNENFALDSSKELFGINPQFMEPLPQQPLILLDQLIDPTQETHSTFGADQQGKSKIELMPGSAFFVDPYAESPIFCPPLATRELASCESE